MNTLIMGSYTDVKNLIISNIKANGQREITGPILQDVLLNMLENSSRVEEITYSDLKALRDGAKLTPSRLYRITDYITTTVQSNTKSARHPFDAIVLAISESELLEQAWAIQHEGDEYFTDSNLSDWEIWYCLDNDTSRFAWADEENGKGVIYRMIDEFNNDIPYDFKNIIYVFKTSFIYNQWGNNYEFNRDTSIDMNINNVQYYGYVSENTPSAWSESKCWIKEEQPTISSQLYKKDGSVISYGGSIEKLNLDNYETYTFGRDRDDSRIGNCYNNNILPYSKYYGKQILNKNIFRGSCYNNIFSYNCYNNMLGMNCYNNFFGSRCYGNISDYSFYNNTFGSNCYNNTFNSQSNNNTFGSNCNKNTFDGVLSNNTFESNCYNNLFGSFCENNFFGSNFNHNTLGSNFYCNTFGSSCEYNIFATDTSGSTPASYFAYNRFESGVSYCNFSNSETASFTMRVKNYYFKSSVFGTSSNKRVIEVTRNLPYDITVALNSKGDLKIYCEADLIK